MIPTTPQGKPLRFLSVCSGMEAASIAFEPLGWKAVGFCEIDPYASAVLAHRFPNTPNYGDLTKYKQWPLEPGTVDVLIGGPPCQAFSVAGLRRGLADPRGSVTLSYLSLVDRLRPEWIIYENVPGLLSVDGGATFGGFLHALGQLGYGWAYRVLDAQHVGECRLHPHRRGWSAVPQRRRRVFVVARRGAGGWASAAEVLSLREGVQRHLTAGGKKRQGVAPDAGSGAEEGCWWDGGQVSQTLDAVLQKGQTMPEKNRFPAVLQPVQSHWEGGDIHPTLNQAHNIGSPRYSNQELFSQKGAGLVPIPFRKSKRAQSATDSESWVEGQQSNTLNNFDVGDTRTTHAVVEQQVYENHAQDSRVTGPHAVAPTVAAKFGTGGGNVPLVGPMAVRRLTPNECLRLQGFPDGWTNIPWKGKPTAPDGPQYKCAGNSFAVPVVRWIGTRIAAQP